MNVLFDMSLLGNWHQAAAMRTGVFRVASEWVRELHASAQCELMFGASSGWAEALDYIAAQELDRGTHLAHSNFQTALSGVGKRWRTFLNQSPSDRRLPARAARWVAARGLNRIDRIAGRLSESALQRADIYQSPLPEVHPQLRGPGTSAAAHRLAKFVTVYDLIALLHPEFYEPEAARNIQRSLRAVSKDHWVAAISEATRNDLIAAGDCDPEKVIVTPLAASEHFYPCEDQARIAQMREVCGIPPGPYLLSLCTLEPRKNLDFLVRSFARLLREEGSRLDPNLRLVLVGNKGWKYQALLAAMEADPALRGRVLLTGFVPDDALAALYSGAEAFLYLSLYEGFGLPPLEAMQCGVPVITSNTSSLPEVVGDGGVMVDPRDEAAFCQALLQLLTHPEERPIRAAKALARAQQFSWKRSVEQLLAGYRRALDERGR